MIGFALPGYLLNAQTKKCSHVKYRIIKIPDFEGGLMKYCIEQEEENYPFFLVRLHGKKPILESILYSFNYCNGLHIFLRDWTPLVSVGFLIVAVSR